MACIPIGRCHGFPDGVSKEMRAPSMIEKEKKMRFLDQEKRIISFVGFSGSGKTTFIEQLIMEIKRRGFSVAVIKHDAHRFQMDREGKDTYRFYEAGSDCVAICSEEKSAVIKRNDSCPDVHEMIDSLPGSYDVILVEGYRMSDLPKIGVSRKATGKGLSLPTSELCAVITDEEITDIEAFALDDFEGVAEFILTGAYL